ncbi:MAG: SDR family NAD(P)-dependent oxidoreductase [Beijerinckiaceae bacterium]
MSAGINSQRCLVVGGAKGIGAAIVATLAAVGHPVVFTYRSSPDDADVLMARVRQNNPDAHIQARRLDLSDATALKEFCAQIADEDFYGLIYNAGQSADALAAMMDTAKAQAAMQVNFWAFTQMAQALIRPMTMRRAGRIIAIGSVAAMRGNQGNAAYAASKGALMSYMRTLAIETAKRGVTVNTIAPGFVDTDMMSPYEKYRAVMEKQIPAGRFAQPQDVAALVAFLVSAGAAYITGATLPVDGGLTASIGIHRS